MAQTRIIYVNTQNLKEIARSLEIDYKSLNQVQRTAFQKEHAPILESKRGFRLDGVEVKVRLNLKEMYFEIYRGEEVLYKGGNTKNINLLKVQAKDYVASLGYDFGTEDRTRKEPNVTSEVKSLS